MIWSRTWRILELMGLHAEFSTIAHAPPDGSLETGFDYRRSDQPEEGFRFQLVRMPCRCLFFSYRTFSLLETFSDGCIRFHRAHFLDVFVDKLPTNTAHFKMKLISYTQPDQDGPILLNFADGSVSSCDLLVGADGIKSTIRAQMFREVSSKDGRPELLDFIEPVFTGTIAYRGLIPVGSSLPPMHRAVKDPIMVRECSFIFICLNVVVFDSTAERARYKY
jgi:salicylate hydroxylase